MTANCQTSSASSRLELAADTGLHIMTYTADARSESEQALRLLGSWAATTAAEHETP